ncbi:transcription elongation factor SPT4 [Drosophila kikkawai]|uniref:Transcription elongation factor SPT4 n=1 Tax=Drosophila kikkawai TaxID=30033 RepID=A0A6P4IXP5_DROKI|nr:transcription elongation factor SPT4 [Drosophila kikkawai]XP_020806212.1 transcription elongation factor SPT4 [Drosophila serrata]KAH8234432.1 hypothetical protein KR038_009926 [Drosophila bunnanda]KAH8290539.1 hypothetical protein KR054_003794 [Drosophila jambulina]KAH8337000.1 hypothetical protein KR059_010618 [Drosophila kikkawai]KAH8375389.1 hypothetical protein KR200_002883 [Drosophila serrata]
MSFDAIPKDLRGLRACLVCSLIKSFDQFETDGCENCEEFLRMKNNKDNVYDHTSNNFDGLIALTTPTDSWVAKWQRIGRFNRGIYAISVSGTLPQSTLRDMKNRGIVYKTRDRSQR